MNGMWRSSYHSNVSGRFHFVESLNGITLGICLKMKEYAFTFCIIVEQQYLLISWKFLFILELGKGVSDIWSTPVPHKNVRIRPCGNS